MGSYSNLGTAVLVIRADNSCSHRRVTKQLLPRDLAVGLQVNVPGADLGEILPAARLLSRATALTPSDYERAKGLFLAGVDRAGLAAEVPCLPALLWLLFA